MLASGKNPWTLMSWRIASASGEGLMQLWGGSFLASGSLVTDLMTQVKNISSVQLPTLQILRARLPWTCSSLASPQGGSAWVPALY